MNYETQMPSVALNLPGITMGLTYCKRGHLFKEIINSKIYIIHTSYIYTIYLNLKDVYAVVNSFKCLNICSTFPWENNVKAEQVHELTK